MGVHTRRRLTNALEHASFSFLSKTQPNKFREARKYKHWIDAIEEELNQTKKNETWKLVQRPKDKNVIGTK